MSAPPDDDPRLTTRPAEQATADAEGHTVTVSGGRTVTVGSDVVELRSPSGLLELRVLVTPDGPVLQVEGVKVAIAAAESVTVETRRFEVRAAEGMALHTDGELDLTSEKEMRIKATEDCVVRGKIIHLN